MLNNRKKILNSKCWGQFSCFNTPPQEQGRLGANSSIYEMYNVNNAISKIEAVNPYFLVFGKNNKTEVVISTIGNNHESVVALDARSGDFANTI